MRYILAFAVSLVISHATAAHEFAVGEVWSFKARKHEPNAKVAIAHIERGTPEGDVYFVHLIDVKLALKGGSSRVNSFGATPVLKASLDASVIAKVAANAKLPYESGYKTWKELRDQAGVKTYAKPLVELEDHHERTVWINR